MGRPIAYPRIVEIPFKGSDEFATINTWDMSLWIPSKPVKYWTPCVKKGNGPFIRLTHEEFQEFIRCGVPEYVVESVTQTRMIVSLTNMYNSNLCFCMFPESSD